MTDIKMVDAILNDMSDLIEMERDIMEAADKAGDDGTNDMVNRFMHLRKIPGCSELSQGKNKYSYTNIQLGKIRRNIDQLNICVSYKTLLSLYNKKEFCIAKLFFVIIL